MSFEGIEEFGILRGFYHENLNKMLMFKFNNKVWIESYWNVKFKI